MGRFNLAFSSIKTARKWPSVKLILSNDQSKIHDLNAQWTALTPKERMNYAAKKFGIFFGLAIASVFIPVAHFFLVPLFLILSLVVGFKSYAIRYRLDLGQQLKCHQCQNELKPSYLLGDELRIKCEKCFAQYAIEK
jgi:hypothetical protein